MDNRYTYLIKDHCRVESLRRRMANGISLITNLELQLSTLSRSPVFSNLSYFFPRIVFRIYYEILQSDQFLIN